MRVAALVSIVCSLALGAEAQTVPTPSQPPSTPPPAATAGAPATPPPEAPIPEAYSYDAGGRRDPFLNLLGAGTESPISGGRGEGAAGLTVAEISVRGVMQSRGALIAMVQGPDNKTYLVHQGDKLADGAIKTISPQGLVIVQDVNDPLSLVKQREVRKLLRSAEGARQ
jgi:Tfp pilus assembly protein PilP